MNEGSAFVLLYLVVTVALHMIPIYMGVRHHRKLRDKLDGAGAVALLEKHGDTPFWHTHGRGVVWEGTERGRRVAVDLRLDPKKRIYARIRVEQKAQITDGLFVTQATCPILETIGWREAELEQRKDEDWTIRFNGADGFGFLSRLERWDPSRDKGPIPTDIGDTMEIRLGRWLEVGYRDIDPGELRGAIQMQAQLLEQLETEEDRAWKQLVLEHGMVRTRDHLAGRVRGRPVEVRYDDATGRTRVESAFSGPPMTLAHKDHIEATRPIGNPVLGMLVGAWAPQDVDLERGFGDEALCEALLAVVHAWPGSRVHAGRIELLADERLRDRLPDAVEAVVTLGERLETAWS